MSREIAKTQLLHAILRNSLHKCWILADCLEGPFLEIRHMHLLLKEIAFILFVFSVHLIPDMPFL